MTARNEWRDRAVCLGMDVDLFFRDDGSVPVEAWRACEFCLVRAECLEFALSIPTTVGYWAGTTQREQHRIRRQRGAAA